MVLDAIRKNMLPGKCVRTCALAGMCTISFVSAAWDTSTPQPDKYELPPASPEVVKEAKAAKMRIGAVSPSALVAHRGESWVCPENTLPAFAAAVAGGFAFECDLWLSKDGVLFVTHDVWIGAKKGHAAHGWATNMVWSGSLEKSDVGVWKAPEWRGTRMPTIDDVLPWAGAVPFIQLHVCDPRTDMILPRLKEALARHPNATAGNVIVSTSAAGREWMRRNMPGFRLTDGGLLRNGWYVTDAAFNVKAIAEKLDPAKVSVWTPRWDETLLTSEAISMVRRKGVKVMVWTVNDAASAWSALGRGADFVLTDRPSALLREMKEF